MLQATLIVKLKSPSSGWNIAYFFHSRIYEVWIRTIVVVIIPITAILVCNGFILWTIYKNNKEMKRYFGKLIKTHIIKLN